MVRFKNRYLFCHIMLDPSARLVPASTLPLPKTLLDQLRCSYTHLFGELLSGPTFTGLSFRYYNAELRCFLLRTPRDHVKWVRAMITMMTEIGVSMVGNVPGWSNVRCSVHVLYVAGTIRSAKIQAIKWMWEELRRERAGRIRAGASVDSRGAIRETEPKTDQEQDQELSREERQKLKLVQDAVRDVEMLDA